MIYTPQTKAALRLCYRAHEGQTDRGGLPYVFHPLHIAEQMTDELTVTAALLHDVLEDTDLTVSDLLSAGISREAAAVVEVLTRREAEDYFEYISRIAQSPAARAVKLADLRHNSDLSRLDAVSDKDIIRREKYARAIEMLS